MKIETENAIWDFFTKTSERLSKRRKERLNDPVTKQLQEKVAERLGLPKNTSLDNLVRTLKLM